MVRGEWPLTAVGAAAAAVAALVASGGTAMMCAGEGEEANLAVDVGEGNPQTKRLQQGQRAEQQRRPQSLLEEVRAFWETQRAAGGGEGDSAGGGGVAANAVEKETDASLANWSDTHQWTGTMVLPRSAAELSAVLRDAMQEGRTLRPVGSGLSPNGLPYRVRQGGGYEKNEATAAAAAADAPADADADAAPAVAESSPTLLSLAHLDNVIGVDTQRKEVTVEAGATVAKVLEVLDEHGMTLQNFSSIQEQQLGGWTQVAAHGTGATLPTVEEQITAMLVYRPDGTLMEVAPTNEHADLFPFLKCGLGTLGVTYAMRLKCERKHYLLEHTGTTTTQRVAVDHLDRLRRFRHVRYMWIPHTDTVVTVTSNKGPSPQALKDIYWTAARAVFFNSPVSREEQRAKIGDCERLHRMLLPKTDEAISQEFFLQLAAYLAAANGQSSILDADWKDASELMVLPELLRMSCHDRYVNVPGAGLYTQLHRELRARNPDMSKEDVDAQLESLRPLPASETLGNHIGRMVALRDRLIGLNPLDPDLVKRVNAAEARDWTALAGFRFESSVDTLGFECGGQQWVLEVAFPIGSITHPSAHTGANGGAHDALRKPTDGGKGAAYAGRDLEFVQDVLQVIRENNLPAPAPIEQRWTARSTAPLSPAYSEDPNDVFSWVGIIMYMPPSQSSEERDKITSAFQRYCDLLAPVFRKYGAVAHWAKVEPYGRSNSNSNSSSGSGSAASDGAIPRPGVPRTSEDVRERYFRLQRLLDPAGVLRNPLVEDALRE